MFQERQKELNITVWRICMTAKLTDQTSCDSWTRGCQIRGTAIKPTDTCTTGVMDFRSRKSLVSCTIHKLEEENQITITINTRSLKLFERSVSLTGKNKRR